MTDHELVVKWIRKVVQWKTPYSTTSHKGRVVSVKNGFLIIRDSIGTEGIKEDWVIHTYK